MNIVNNSDDLRKYRVLVGEPYLTKNAAGKYVILQDETMFSEAKPGSGIDQCYTTEVLINPAPTKKDIFEFKLRGAVRKNTFLTDYRSGQQLP